MGGDDVEQIFSCVLVRGFFELMGEIEIIPADDAVLDQPVAGLGDFLLFLFGLGELAGIANGDSAGKTVGQFDLVELLLNGLAQFNVIDIA